MDLWTRKQQALVSAMGAGEAAWKEFDTNNAAGAASAGKETAEQMIARLQEHGFDIIERPSKDELRVILDMDEAKRICWGLSDLLCWVRGFNAANVASDHTEFSPMGDEQARRIKELIDSKIDEVEKPF
ncbi:MAG: hypothetical protein CL843_19690 [Crocinitomicaceae bacterium]|nr:hypothetical protein [Crocinitomicaceae bacterium]